MPKALLSISDPNAGRVLWLFLQITFLWLFLEVWSTEWTRLVKENSENMTLTLSRWQQVCDYVFKSDSMVISRLQRVVKGAGLLIQLAKEEFIQDHQHVGCQDNRSLSTWNDLCFSDMTELLFSLQSEGEFERESLLIPSELRNQREKFSSARWVSESEPVSEVDFI